MVTHWPLRTIMLMVPICRCSVIHHSCTENVHDYIVDKLSLSVGNCFGVLEIMLCTNK